MPKWQEVHWIPVPWNHYTLEEAEMADTLNLMDGITKRCLVCGRPAAPNFCWVCCGRLNGIWPKEAKKNA